MTFEQALLKLALAVLDLTDGETVCADQYDVNLCEDDRTITIHAHVGDDAAAVSLDAAEGKDVEALRAVLNGPSRAFRVLDAAEVRRRLAS